MRMEVFTAQKKIGAEFAPIEQFVRFHLGHLSALAGAD
jgi:hypothetical protein